MSESESSSQVSPSVDENIPKWHPPARRYALLVILCLSQFPPGLNSGAMFTALPFLEVDLHIPESNLTWIMNAFNLTMSSFLLISGRISDIYNPKYTFTCGLFVFGVMSIGAGFVTNAISLIIIQGINGIATAFVIPSAFRHLVDVFPKPKEKARAVGLFVCCELAAEVSGFSAGAALAQFANWSWIFWLTALIALPTSVAGFLLIPNNMKQNNDNSNAPHVAKWKSLDLTGVGILTAALILFNFAITSGSRYGWGSVKVLVPLLISTSMLAGFFYYETRIPPSIASIPPSTWFLPNFSALIGVSFIPGLWRSLVSLEFSTLWQGVYHWSAMSNVLHMLPSIIPIIAIGFTGPLSRIIKTKWILLFAQGITIISMILFHFADAPERYFPFVFPALILGSTGSTLTNIHASIAIFRSTPSSLAGTIGAIWNGVIRLGSPVGLAVASAIQIGVEAKHGGPTSYAGRAASFWFMLALLVTSTIPLLIFYRNETDGNNPSIEEGSEREKVLEGKSNELVISEVLEV